MRIEQATEQEWDYTVPKGRPSRIPELLKAELANLKADGVLKVAQHAPCNKQRGLNCHLQVAVRQWYAYTYGKERKLSIRHARNHDGEFNGDLLIKRIQ